MRQVFHDASAETRYFQKLGIDPTGFSVGLPPSEYTSPFLKAWPAQPLGLTSESTGPTPTIIVQDTQNLYCGWSEPSVKQINLGKACAALGLDEVEVDKLHNAGNDAFATLRVWETLLELEGTQVTAEAEESQASPEQEPTGGLQSPGKQAGSHPERTAPAGAVHKLPETAKAVGTVTGNTATHTNPLIDLDPLFADPLSLSVQPRAVSAVASLTNHPTPAPHCPVGNLIDL